MLTALFVVWLVTTEAFTMSVGVQCVSSLVCVCVCVCVCVYKLERCESVEWCVGRGVKTCPCRLCPNNGIEEIREP